MTQSRFSPYGFLNQADASLIGLKVPVEWVPLQYESAGTREEQWLQWRSDVLRVLNDVLWPSWDPKVADWTNSPARQHMEALTRADFAVFGAMDADSLNRGLEKLPDSPNRATICFTHREMFTIEDDRALKDGDPIIPFASFYPQYDSKLPKEVADLVRPLWFQAIRQKLSNTHVQIKLFMQRPRAYQTALLLGLQDFINEEGKTALTPSMCSGHCLQGLTGVGGVLEYLRLRGIHFDSDNDNSLRQFGVDIGDRRVMAGIHYPSDNLSSWIILGLLADHIYRDPIVKTWLGAAIKTRSAVYREITKVAATEAGKALRPALDEVNRLFS